MTYDIFISYKRKSLATANNLYYRLTTRGYSTFFDLDEMKKDNFDVQLLHYIENAKDVFVILEDGSLDACKTEEWNKDWFCKEIAHAIKTKRNIIPILLGGYQMPNIDTLPNELKELTLKNAPEFSFSYFEEYLNKLVEKGYITAEAQALNKTTSVFKFYSNEDCQVLKEGKSVCSLEGMSDEPFYLPVPRKGDYRFKCINSITAESQILKEHIDTEEEKNVEVWWNKTIRSEIMEKVSKCAEQANLNLHNSSYNIFGFKTIEDYWIFNFTNRIVPIEELNSETSYFASLLMLLYDRESSKDIKMYINSWGGQVCSCLEIYDTMQFVNSNIVTIVTGIAGGCAAFLLMSGCKGKRYAKPHSRIRLCDICTSGTNVRESVEAAKLKKELINIGVEHTGQPTERINENMSQGLWLTPQEAIRYGIVDYVCAS